MTQEKELKRQIRALRKLKRQTRPKTPEKRQLNYKIRELKAMLVKWDEELKANPAKQILIDKLTQLYQDKRKPMLVDLKTYTEEQLQNHLEKLGGK
jgi:hypothetical protein